MEEKTVEDILENYFNRSNSNNYFSQDLEEKQTKIFTLQDITNKMFDMEKTENYNLDEEKERLDQQREDYYKAQQKKFIDIVHVLGLDEEIKLLKVGKSYQFYEDDVSFWINILSNYTKEPFDSLRRGNLDGIEDGYIVWICKGIINAFYNTNVPKEQLDLIIEKLDLRFDYQQRLQREQIAEIHRDIEETIQNLDLLPEVYTRKLFPIDKSEWKLRFAKAYKEFWDFQKRILKAMYDIREKEYYKLKSEITKEEWQIFRKGNEIDIEITNRLEESEEYKRLDESLDKVNGTKELREGKKKKTPYLKSIEKPVNKLLEDREKYIEKITDQVIEDLYPQFNYQEYEKICEHLFSPKISEKELYEWAKKIVKKNLKPDKRIKKELSKKKSYK